MSTTYAPGWEGWGSPEWQKQQEDLLNAGTTAHQSTGPWGVDNTPAPAPAPAYAPPPAPAPISNPYGTNNTQTNNSQLAFGAGPQTQPQTLAGTMQQAYKPSNQEIQSYFEANKSNPNLIVQQANQYGLSLADIMGATGYNQQEADDWLKWAGVSQGPNGFQMNPAAAPQAPGAATNPNQAIIDWYSKASPNSWDPYFENEQSWYKDANGQVYQPTWEGRDLLNNQAGTISQFSHYKPLDDGKYFDTGGQYELYDKDANFDSMQDYQPDEWAKTLAMFAAAVGGMMFLPGGALSSSFGAGTMAAQNGMEAFAGHAGLGGGGVGAGAAGAGAGSGVTVGGPMSTGLPAGTALPSMGQMGGMGAAAAGAAGAAGAGGAANAGLGGLLSQVGSKGLGALLPALLGGGGQGGSGAGGMDLMSLLSLLGAGWGSSRTADAGKDMTAWLNSQQAKIDNLYAPGSPEYDYLMQEMSRKDAAAGRNSQYGPRSVDLAAKIAGIKADNTAKLTTGIGHTYASALNQNANAYAGLPALMASMGQQGGAGGTGGGVQNLSSLINSLFSGGSGNGQFLGEGMLSGIPEWDEAWQRALDGGQDFIDYGDFI